MRRYWNRQRREADTGSYGTIVTVFDHDAVARALRVRERAAQKAMDVQASGPPGVPDANEIDFELSHHTWYRRTNEDAAGELAWRKAEQADLASSIRGRDLEEVLVTARTNAEQLQIAFRQELVTGCRSAEEARREVAAFRYAHDVARAPRVVENRSAHLLGLALSLVGEAGGNCAIFARTNPTGYIGGFADALSISVLNVGMGFVVGMLLHGLNAGRIRQGLAILAATLYAVSLPIFHLLVGHYRHALGGLGADDAFVRAIDAFYAAPLAVYDLATLQLWIVGLTAAACALIAGWRWDDPIPGYGAAARQHLRADGYYRNLREAYLAGIRQIFSDAHVLLDQRYATAREALQRCWQSIVQTQRTVEALRRAQGDIGDSAVRCRELYRGLVAGIRGGESTMLQEPSVASGPRVADPEPGPDVDYFLAHAERVNALLERTDLRATRAEVATQLGALAERVLASVDQYFKEVEREAGVLTKNETHPRAGCVSLGERFEREDNDDAKHAAA